MATSANPATSSGNPENAFERALALARTQQDAAPAMTDANTVPVGVIPGTTTPTSDGVSVTRRGNPYIDSLAWMVAGDPFRDKGKTGKTVITFAFGDAQWYSLLPGSDTRNGIRSVTWNADHGPQGPVKLMNGDKVSFGTVTGEQAGVLLAQALWQNVANITFKNIGSDKVLSADLKYIITDNAGMREYWRGAADWEYPFTETPADTGDKAKMGFTVLNKDYENYKDYKGPKNPGLGAGSLGLYDTVHEIGHQLGLDHPWKEEKGAPFFPGATSEGDMGDYRLNQGIYTVMSYSYGWINSYRKGDDGMPPQDFGSAIGPMAFDIAAIQAIYGANRKYHEGDDTYVLPKENKTGIGWMCIWDTGGTDAIVAPDDAGDSIVDLRGATLNSEDGAGAGGYISYVKGVMGGFTIAHGAVIENAKGGKGNDSITGNDADNSLYGKAGNDTLRGGAGNDYIDGGEGDDIIDGGAGADYLVGGNGKDSFTYTQISDFGTLADYDVIDDFQRGNDIIDLRPLEKTLNCSFSFSESKTFTGKAYELIFVANKSAGYGYLLGNLYGGSDANFRLQLSGVTQFSASDLRL